MSGVPASALDLRRHLSAAIGWAVFTLVTLAALLAASLAGNETERRARADTERLLAQFASQIGHALAMSLETRRSILQATAAQIVVSSDRGSDALRRHVEAVQAQFPEFAWIGVADERGRVTAASGGVLEGEDAAAQRWFQQGRQGPHLGDVGEAPLLANRLPPIAGGEPARFIEAAVPLTPSAGGSVGVLGAYLSWHWIEQQLGDLRRALDTRRQLDLLLIGEGGTVLAGSAPWLGRSLAGDADLTGGGAYVVGRQAEHRGRDGGLAWKVVVREGAEAALEPARATQQAVFGVVFAASLLAAAAGVLATRLLTRRLAALAREAQAVRGGAQRTFTVPVGGDEVSRIGATLAEVVDHLQHEKQALQRLNGELDARVAERTARIERLSDETRHAAVTRERLRLARDLHHTLAHSLMALLTQIRLVRKLHSRFKPAQLDAELARAEDVAASGLIEARAAITQMRHNSVRDVGLGAALQELVAQFGERTSIAATWHADPQAAGLADERAETVFQIVEEALHNVEHHAQAASVSVGLRWAAPADDVTSPPARVRVEIADDGAGFDPASPRPGHYGLIGMREQAVLIGARFDVQSRIGEGTRLVLEFDA